VSQLTAQGDQTGLVVWRGEGPNNFAKVVFNRRQTAPGTGYWFERQNNVDGVTQGGGGSAGDLSNPPAGGVYIRVSSDGATNPTISAAYSLNGTDWVAVKDPFQLGGTGPIKVGPAYWRTTATTAAAVDWFRVTSAACGVSDSTAPTTAHALAPAAPNGSGGWYTTSPQVTLSATDNTGGSGVARTEYRIDGAAAWTPYTAAFAAPAGSHTIEYRSVDVAGNTETAKSVAVKVDGTAPAVTRTTDPAEPQGADGWFTAAPQVTLTATDNAGGSGVASREYRIDGGAWTAYSAPFTVPAGTHTVEYRATDTAGNAGAPASFTVKVDPVAPTVTANSTPGEPNGKHGWYVTKPALSFTGADAGGSGLDRVDYSVNGGTWRTYGQAFVLDDGTTTIDYRARDRAGSISAVASRTFKVDTAAPTTTPAADGTGPVTVSATATDGSGSGITTTQMRIDGGAWSSYTGPRTVTEPGLHTVEVQSTDAAGNEESVRQLSFRIPDGTQAQGDPPKPGGSDRKPALAIGRARGLTVRTFRRSGLRVAVSCAWIDSGRLTLTVSSKVARKLGLRGTRTLASARVRCDVDGRMTVVLPPSDKAEKALRKAKGPVRATLTLRMDSGDVSLSDRAAVRLRGTK
jgi:hypothetical protein